MTYRRI